MLYPVVLPGTLHLIPLPSGILERRAVSSTTSHGWGLAESLQMMAALGRPIPRAFLLGVEVEAVAPGGVLSPAVETAVQVAISRFPDLCNGLVEAENKLFERPRQFSPGDRAFPGGLVSGVNGGS